MNDAFARDSTTVYYKQYPVDHADVASFEALDDHYAKDINNAYYCDEYREGQNYYLTKRQTVLTIPNAQTASFVTLENGYAKDSLKGYFQGTPFAVKDLATLKSLDMFFAKDDVQVYLNMLPVEGSDGKTFELIDRNYAKDTGQVYFFEFTGGLQKSILVLPCNSASFEILEYPFAKDASSVFYAGKPIKGADALSFQILKNGYARDKSNVYFTYKKIVGADLASFETYTENELLMGEFYYARDKASVFLNEKVLTGADVASFKPLTLGYGSDTHHVFYHAQIVKNASPASFQVYPHAVGDADAEDAQHRYLEGVKVKAENDQ